MSQENQKPIGSGFGAKTPAADVVKGMDLSGNNIIVTGGYSGIGIEEVRALAGVGAHVTVPARRPDAAKEALAEVEGQIEVASMDLADLASVRKFADDYLGSGRQLDILINNAGITRDTLLMRMPGLGKSVWRQSSRPYGACAGPSTGTEKGRFVTCRGFVFYGAHSRRRELGRPALR